VYKQRNVEALEEAWLGHLKDTKGMTIVQVAQLKNGGGPTKGQTTGGGTVVRLTAPPTEAVGSSPVVRGVAPEEEPRPVQPAHVLLGSPQFIPADQPGPFVPPPAPVPAAPRR